MTTLSREQYEAKTERRFWSKVTKTDYCWLWAGTMTSNGYGRYSVSYPGCKAREVKAHRYSWSLQNGPIPEGMEIDHACHTQLCVRPSHLRPATRKQNSENRQGARKDSRSHAWGVSWDASHGMWKARVGHNGRQVHAGLFHDLEDAAEAARTKRLELYTHNIVDRTPFQTVE